MKNLGLLRKNDSNTFFVLHVEKPSKYFPQLFQSFLEKSQHGNKLQMNYSARKEGVLIGIGYESRTSSHDETIILIQRIHEFFRTFFPARYAEIFLDKIIPDETSRYAIS